MTGRVYFQRSVKMVQFSVYKHYTICIFNMFVCVYVKESVEHACNNSFYFYFV